MTPKHPAKFSPSIIAVMDRLVRAEAEQKGKRLRRFRILDPMAGVGGVHQLPGVTVGIELEQEWADAHCQTQQGDCLHLPFRRDHFDAIVVSPVYGNRMSDHHNAQDGSYRRSYTHDLGRDLTPGSSGAMAYRDDHPWASPYRVFHRAAWKEAIRVLRPDGLFLLNVSDFIAQKRVQHVSGWHMNTLTTLGCTMESIEVVSTPRMRMGANRERTPGEFVIAMRGPS